MSVVVVLDSISITFEKLGKIKNTQDLARA